MSRVAILLVCVTAAACGGSPAGPDPSTSPAPSPLSMTGEWSGFFLTETCSGGISCFSGGILPFTLRTAVSGSTADGAFDWGESEFPIRIQGTLSADGALQLAGSLPSFEASASSFDVEIQARHDAAAGLAGTVTITRRGPFAGTLNARIQSASMRPLLMPTGGAAEGTWEGVGVIRGCASCTIGRIGQRVGITLRLAQNGAGASGHAGVFIAGADVAGSLAGMRLSLSGESRYTLDRFNTGATLVRIESLTGDVDALGRMSGHVRYYREGQANVSFRIVPFAETVDVEMLMLVRRY